MRIISGSRKGMRLLSPNSMKIRPTEDRIKESIFNVLFNIKEGSRVLDGFAGTGSVGIEFLSRGSSKAVFVDKSKEALDLINSNLEKAKFKDFSHVHRGDLIIFLKNVSQEDYDYIFLDPPYKMEKLLNEAINTIIRYKKLSKNGIMIVERDSSIELDYPFDDIYLYNEKKYGNKIISYFSYKCLGEDNESDISRIF